MEFELSKHAKDVMVNRNIVEDWVYEIVNNPSISITVEKDEIHLYGTIEIHNNRCLKVVFNPLKRLVITTYFDRKMKKKGCK